MVYPNDTPNINMKITIRNMIKKKAPSIHNGDVTQIQDQSKAPVSFNNENNMNNIIGKLNLGLFFI